MKLSWVDIKNFRSIKDFRVDFEPTACRVFVGINESGKSNALKALALLSPSYKPSRINDLREKVGKETPITESYVRFLFKLEKIDIDALFMSVSSQILANVKNPDIALFKSKKLSLKEFCIERSEGLYTVDILEESKTAKYWALTTQKLVPGWKKPSSQCPDDYMVPVGAETKKLKDFKLVRALDFQDIPVDYLEEASIEVLGSLIGNNVTRIVKEKLPETVFWKYEESDLLPNSIDISAFADKPASYPPLRNMFILAGIPEEDIKTNLGNALKGTPNQIQNYFNHIADQTTDHFKNVWEEYRNISFSLRHQTNVIVPGIKEENTHDLEKRSDGFKRFVTFLLMISVKVKTKQMENTLLIIDEPEMSLHPTGARYLRDELIRIAKKNYVAYSTHSIFMIDSSNIERHYIVQKKGEISTLEVAKNSNLAEEEVLWNALGYSVFELLKPKNLIFEGWKDKRIFQVAIPHATAEIKKKFDGVGICHAKGVSSMKAITPIIELAKRVCLIVSDGDTQALSEQKRYKQDKGYGSWLTYQEVDSAIVAITGEDFIKNDYITKSLNIVLKDMAMPKFDSAVLPSDKGKLSAILSWLIQNDMTVEQAKLTLATVKDQIFEHLEVGNIEESYNVLLRGIKL